MKTFTIDSNNVIATYASDVWAGEGAVKFQMEQELAALAALWPGSRLVEIWNQLRIVRPVRTPRAACASRRSVIEDSTLLESVGGSEPFFVAIRGSTAIAEIENEWPANAQKLPVNQSSGWLCDRLL